MDKIKQQQQFDEELVKTQQEIQEETLKHVGRELHDNVGQLLAVASMQMKAVNKIVGESAKPKVDSASQALNDSLTEVRALSKSLNSDVIFNQGFEVTVENEVKRLNKSGLVIAELFSEGDKVVFENKKDETILFRILQEFFSNTLKYAEAEHLSVVLNYNESSLIIQVKDDGNGFEVARANHGSGLINMKKRAELVNATFNLESQPEKGTVLTLVYPYKVV
ncbi:sensor histidine kinase [Winogradskyella ursingii]|uniref:sensor histidine kinase n=1 Tax=Winogradskyella ursingii TaxID=2686079 RepID=UPI001FE67D71|nr:sensor histidine kinase [Winogradskyella ursingii]